MSFRAFVAEQKERLRIKQKNLQLQKKVRVAQHKSAQGEWENDYSMLSDQVIKWQIKSTADKCKIMIPGEITSKAYAMVSFTLATPIQKSLL